MRSVPMLEMLLSPATYVSLLSLTLLEIVLGIDNIIFISILAGKLSAEERDKARTLGLVCALGGRLLLLFSISWLVQLTKPLLEIASFAFSGKDLVLLGGGLFLIAKSAHEIYEKVEAHDEHQKDVKPASFANAIVQIMLIDIVFSLDSIITAVGLVNQLPVMIMAIIISMGIMLIASKGIGEFIDRHPSIKVLALSFLLMIGTMLVAEAFQYHVPKEYIYFSLAFALFVEFINIKARANTKPH